MSPKPISDRDVYRYDLLYDAPDYVKSAALVELVGDADEHSRAPSTRTKGATWVATAHFLEHAADLPDDRRGRLAATLAAAARLHGIEADVEDLCRKHAATRSLPAAGLPDSAFGWIVKDASGATVDRRLRLLNAAEVKAAAAWLLEHRDRFLLADRMKIARRVVARAWEVGADLGGDAAEVDKVAGYGVADPEAVRAALAQRLQLLRAKHAAAADGVLELRKAIEEHPEALAARPRRLKLAETLDQLDRDFRLQHHYKSAGLVRPEDAAFGVTEQAAAAVLADHVEIGDGVYRKAALEAVDPAALADRLGEKLATSLAGGELFVDADRMAIVAAGLPAGEARLVQQALKSAGVTPVGKAAAGPRLSRDELLRLADELPE